MFQEMNNDIDFELIEVADMLRDEDHINDNLEPSKKINAPIFRFKFTEAFMEDLYKFSKIHQYDHRKDFKEAWTKWIEENDDIVPVIMENQALEQLSILQLIVETISNSRLCTLQV